MKKGETRGRFQQRKVQRPTRPQPDCLVPRQPRRQGSDNSPMAAPQPDIHSSGLPKMVVGFGDTRNKRVRHAWIYDNMVITPPTAGAELDGSTVAVIDDSGKFLGSAIYNSQSRIRGRIFSLAAKKFNADYVRSAVEAAIRRRAAQFDPADSYRLVFADSDALPGVVADKIADVVVVQLLTLAADRQSEAILSALQDLISPRGIVVRRDIRVREKEGLPVAEPQVIGQVPDTIPVHQDGFAVYADLLTGQKTGLFLDQRFNRRLIKAWCRDARVLDLYCHAGAWSFTAALAGAREVIGVDSSAPACALAQRAATENAQNQVRFVTADVFDFLDKDGAEQFDVIISDPPAFAKTRAHVPQALKGYLSLNYRCMKKLKPGGILVSCSCSQYVGVDEFESMLTTAARNARMQFQLLVRAGQPPDHPILLGFPESEYLKCFLLQRME